MATRSPSRSGRDRPRGQRPRSRPLPHGPARCGLSRPRCHPRWVSRHRATCRFGTGQRSGLGPAPPPGGVSGPGRSVTCTCRAPGSSTAFTRSLPWWHMSEADRRQHLGAARRSAKVGCRASGFAVTSAEESNRTGRWCGPTFVGRHFRLTLAYFVVSRAKAHSEAMPDTSAVDTSKYDRMRAKSR